MQRLEYEVSFVTSAFLGNAEQTGQWRTPPFDPVKWHLLGRPYIRLSEDRIQS